MHKFQSGEVLQRQKERLKQMYPVGTRIELNALCNDERDMPPGLRGTVVGMDDQPAYDKHLEMISFCADTS